MKELYAKYGETPLTQMQAVFASIFVLQNRIQTAFETGQSDLTMKQWLLLTIAEVCPEPRTLTNVGKYMGCSRQNTKQLAAALEKKGYVKLVHGAQNSVHIEFTEKCAEHEKAMGDKYEFVLRLLFSQFSEEELLQFYSLFSKLYTGVEKLEEEDYTS